MTVTPYGHVLYIKCCILLGDPFQLHCATAHTSYVLTRDPLPVVQAAFGVNGVFRGRFQAVETVLRHGRIFEGSDAV